MDKKLKYDLLFQLVLHESKAVWDTGQLFLLSNTFLAAIIGTNFPDNYSHKNWDKLLVFWLLSLLGVLISFLWFFSFNRTKNYYRFRMAQARVEEKDSEKFFSGDAREIAQGNTVIIDGEKYSLRVWGFNWSSLSIVNCVIWLFIIFFSFICIHFFPWRIVKRNINFQNPQRNHNNISYFSF